MTAEVSLVSGTTRLLGIWKPETDRGDALQAFLQVDIAPEDDPETEMAR